MCILRYLWSWPGHWLEARLCGSIVKCVSVLRTKIFSSWSCHILLCKKLSKQFLGKQELYINQSVATFCLATEVQLGQTILNTEISKWLYSVNGLAFCWSAVSTFVVFPVLVGRFVFSWSIKLFSMFTFNFWFLILYIQTDLWNIVNNQFDLSNILLWISLSGQGCGSVCNAVAFDKRGPWFESRQFYGYICCI